MKLKPAPHLKAQLRSRRMDGWVEEHRFHPKRKWRFDFAWPERKLAVEVHGAVFQGGRHTQGAGFTNDREKMNNAQLLGWTVLEVTSQQVHDCSAINWIEQALSQPLPKP